MVIVVAAWMSCVMLTLWALLVAGRLRSPAWSMVALVLGVAPLGWLIARQFPWPHLEWLELVGLALGSLLFLGPWGAAVAWARRAPASPKVDAARMRWLPRPSHRPTWVIAVGFSTLLTAALVVLDRPLVALLPWVALFAAHWWAHQGLRGAVRVEARDILLDGVRIAIDELSSVHREVQFLGPVRRERLVLARGDHRVHWLVTGSPTEDVVTVQHLLQQQQHLAAETPVQREPAQRPPAWLRDIDKHRRPEAPLRTNGEPS